MAADITNTYRIRDGVDPETVRAAAIEAVMEEGWTIEDPAGSVARGTKQLTTGSAEVAIYFLDDTQHELIVRLEHERPVPTS